MGRNLSNLACFMGLVNVDPIVNASLRARKVVTVLPPGAGTDQLLPYLRRDLIRALPRDHPGFGKHELGPAFYFDNLTRTTRRTTFLVVLLNLDTPELSLYAGHGGTAAKHGSPQHWVAKTRSFAAEKKIPFRLDTLTDLRDITHQKTIMQHRAILAQAEREVQQWSEKKTSGDVAPSRLRTIFNQYGLRVGGETIMDDVFDIFAQPREFDHCFWEGIMHSYFNHLFYKYLDKEGRLIFKARLKSFPWLSNMMKPSIVLKDRLKDQQKLGKNITKSMWISLIFAGVHCFRGLLPPKVYQHFCAGATWLFNVHSGNMRMYV
jgi:hypothetical protein